MKAAIEQDPIAFFNLIATIAIAFFATLFAGLTWLTSKKLAKLADMQNDIAVKQNEIADRNLWLTGALESHSTIEQIIRAHERGIPVMWWDPHKEKWDPNKQPWHPGRGHRKLAQLPLVIAYIPEDERGPGLKALAPEATPFSDEERQALENERARLRVIREEEAK